MTEREKIEKIAVNFRFKKDLFESLRRLAFERRVSMNSIVSEALEKYLTEEEIVDMMLKKVEKK